jgi:hypothetical protein
MKKVSVHKKEITSNVAKAVEQAIGAIENVKQGKKLKKLVHRSSKKIADKIAEQLKKEQKKKKRTEKSLAKMEKALGGEAGKKKKAKTDKKKDA